VAQDFAASHGMWTEPNTNITFFMSVEDDGPVSGDGEFSETSVGGFKFGIALPENAATVNVTEYIGLIVSDSYAPLLSFTN
jgi:cellobiose dehydrogenase (acceptor)